MPQLLAYLQHTRLLFALLEQAKNFSNAPSWAPAGIFPGRNRARDIVSVSL